MMALAPCLSPPPSPEHPQNNEAGRVGSCGTGPEGRICGSFWNWLLSSLPISMIAPWHCLVTAGSRALAPHHPAMWWGPNALGCGKVRRQPTHQGHLSVQPVRKKEVCAQDTNGTAVGQGVSSPFHRPWDTNAQPSAWLVTPSSLHTPNTHTHPLPASSKKSAPPTGKVVVQTLLAPVMADFRCHLGWVTVPSGLVKHQLVVAVMVFFRCD